MNSSAHAPHRLGPAKIRWFHKSDIPEMVAIEAGSYEQPWPEGDFRATLASSRVKAKVAELCGQVAGYAVYSFVKNEVWLENITVEASVRRSGIGRQLLGCLMATYGNRRRMLCTVSELNLDAHLFLQSCGWRAIEIRRGHCQDGSDGYLFSHTTQEA